MIGIVDYGIGNIKSIFNSLQFNNDGNKYKISLVSSKQEIAGCEKIILPGVGAFGESMNRLHERDLVGVIKDCVSNNVPLLGVCLGMQLLASKSFEGGEIDGLGLIDGKVIKIDWSGVNIPHMGWNSVVHDNNKLFNGIENNSDFYFVHSYHFVPSNKDEILSTTDYGERFVSGIRKGNIYGVQFHPEKSQRDGLRLLRNFMRADNG